MQWFTLFVPRGGDKFVPLCSYFNIAPKLNKIFAFMHPDFESNLNNTHFQKLWGQPDNRKLRHFCLCQRHLKEFHTVLSTMHAYQRNSIHSTASSLLMLIFSWNKTFYLLINVMHHHYVTDDVII